jgi:radical SAM superfamily enzyme YgiQ (UPF0313 family)
VKDIKKYKTAMYSLTSVNDVFRFINAVNDVNRGNCNIIVGGQGAYPLYHYRDTIEIDRVFFGRIDNIADRIIIDNIDHPSLMKMNNIKNLYEIRQAKKLYNNETSVGCRMKCRFCQYSHTRKPLRISRGSDYSANMGGAIVNEDTWRSLNVKKSGRYTTALDGMSEDTRDRIGKKVKDIHIIDKINDIIHNIEGVATIKVYMIMGYPWETEETIRKDIVNLRSIFRNITKTGGGRVVIMFMATPFSPEPLTPMEDNRANLTNWRDVILDSNQNVCSTEKCEAFFLPQINSPLTLLKRIAVNRGVPMDTLKELYSIKGKWSDISSRVINEFSFIADEGYGKRLSPHLTIKKGKT